MKYSVGHKDFLMISFKIYRLLPNRDGPDGLTGGGNGTKSTHVVALQSFGKPMVRPLAALAVVDPPTWTTKLTLFVTQHKHWKF